MKSLYLLRHAKSEVDNGTKHDSERGLIRRGERDAELIGEKLAQLGYQFPNIYCSKAKRAQKTLKKLASASDAFNNSKIIIDENLYTFDHKILLRTLKNLPQELDNALIIGHNPALLELCNVLYGGKLNQLSTCSFIELEINVEYWDQLRADSAQLVKKISPKSLRQPDNLGRE
ncbi:MAG: SixA phosphatase family protein [Spongiibacteraceae bacterium]